MNSVSLINSSTYAIETKECHLFIPIPRKAQNGEWEFIFDGKPDNCLPNQNSMNANIAGQYKVMEARYIYLQDWFLSGSHPSLYSFLRMAEELNTMKEHFPKLKGEGSGIIKKQRNILEEQYNCLEYEVYTSFYKAISYKLSNPSENYAAYLFSKEFEKECKRMCINAPGSLKEFCCNIKEYAHIVKHAQSCTWKALEAMSSKNSF